MNFLSQVLAISAKDLRSELRTKESINAALSFALVVLLLFSFAFDPSSEQLHDISGGLLWLAFAFAGTLILNRSFARELLNDCLDALIASPVTPAQLFLGKAFANFALLLMVEFGCLIAYNILYNSSWNSQYPILFLVMLLGSWGLTVVGTLFSALTVNLRVRELMLPLLVYPMILPVLIAAVRLSTVAIAGEPLGSDDQVWFRVLVSADIIFTILAVSLIDIVLVG